MRALHLGVSGYLLPVDRVLQRRIPYHDVRRSVMSVHKLIDILLTHGKPHDLQLFFLSYLIIPVLIASIVSQSVSYALVGLPPWDCDCLASLAQRLPGVCTNVAGAGAKATRRS